MVLLIIATLVFADDSVKNSCEPEQGSKEMARGIVVSDLPKYRNEYPIATVRSFLLSCRDAGERVGYDRDQTEEFCVCQILFIMDKIPYKDYSEFQDSDMSSMRDFFDEAVDTCVERGHGPKKTEPVYKPVPKSVPKPENPLQTRRSAYAA